MSKSVLLNSVKLGGGAGIELKNRVVLAPLTRARSGRSQVPNDANVLYYTQVKQQLLLCINTIEISHPFIT